MTNLDYALNYLKQGFSVIPIHHPSMPIEEAHRDNSGKIPLLKWEPYQKRRATEEEVRAWWTQWPTANIGIVTGEISGVFVVDADGPLAEEFIKQKSNGSWPTTHQAETGKGTHLYFKHPKIEVRNGARLAPELDVRGDGGYVVAPPSRHRNEGDYAWLDPSAEIVSAPEWILDLVTNRQKQEPKKLSATEVNKLLKGAEQGGRNNQGAKLAGHYFAKGMAKSEVLEHLLMWNERNKPPMSRSEVELIVTSISTAEAKKIALSMIEPRRDGDDFAFTWPLADLSITVTSIRTVHDGLQGELTITLAGMGDIHWGRMNLASTNQREQLVTKLDKVKNTIDWRKVLESVCQEASKRFREGDPVELLLPSEAPQTSYLIDKLLPEKETTVIFGDGGTGKSTFSLALALAIGAEKDLPNGLTPRKKVNVLYLDWESCREEHADRLMALLRGMGVETNPKTILYRPMVRALFEEAQNLRTIISRENIGLVIVDSYGPATGLEAESSEAAIRTMNALRSFAPATRLVISHISKADAQMTGNGARPFGSVYVQNLARSVWFVKRVSDEDDVDLSLTFMHKKTNRGRIQKTVGFRLEYELDNDAIKSIQVKREEVNKEDASMPSRIISELKREIGGLTIHDLAEELGENEGSIKSALFRLEKHTKGDKVRQVSGPKPRKWVVETNNYR